LEESFWFRYIKPEIGGLACNVEMEIYAVGMNVIGGILS